MRLDPLPQAQEVRRIKVKVHIMGWSKTLCGIREYPGIRSMIGVGNLKSHKDACKRCLKCVKSGGSKDE